MTALLDGVTKMNLNLRTVAVKGNVVYLERVDEFSIGDQHGSVPAFGVLVIESGKVAEWREYFDRHELLIEMGAIPEPGTHINFVRALISEWQAGDIDAVLDRVNDDIVFHYRIGVPPARGKAEMREFLEAFKARISDVDWRITNYVEGPDRLMVEGSDSFVDEDGIRSTVPYAGIFEFKNGKISGWRDYFNPALMEQSKTPEGLPDYVVELLSDDEKDEKE